MKQIDGIEAIRLANEVSKLPDGSFTIAFYPYNRTKGEAGDKLVIRKDCTTRPQMPQDKIAVDGDNYFLFKNGDGDDKMCYRYLLRYIGFPPSFDMIKVNWL